MVEFALTCPECQGRTFTIYKNANKVDLICDTCKLSRDLEDWINQTPLPKWPKEGVYFKIHHHGSPPRRVYL